MSAKNARAKQLSEMRRRWQASTNEAVVAGEYEMPAASGTTKKHYDLSQNMPNLNVISWIVVAATDLFNIISKIYIFDIPD